MVLGLIPVNLYSPGSNYSFANRTGSGDGYFQNSLTVAVIFYAPTRVTWLLSLFPSIALNATITGIIF